MNIFTQTLQARLLLTLTAGLTLIIAVVVVSIGALKGNIDGYRYLVEEETHGLVKIEAMNVAFKGQVQEWKNVLLRGHEQSAQDKYWGKFLKQDKHVKEITAELLTRFPSGPVNQALTRFSESHKGLLKKYKAGREAYLDSGFSHIAGDRAVTGIDREPSQLLSELTDKMTLADLDKVEAFSKGSAASIWGAFIGVFVASVIVLFGLNMSIRRQLIRPLQEVVEDIKRMSNGDFTHKLSSNYGGELGELSGSLSKMKSDLGGMIGKIRASTDEIRQASQAFKTSSDGITSDTSKAESFSGQIATAIAQMAATVTEVAGNAANAADATQTADKSANEGLSTMEGAIRAISNVASEVSSISGDMSKLEHDTTSVGAVLDVIKGIAEQTNLLALNAAIEAARAGEQGRGFAVVADEVRALAKRTQESTEEIQHIIETVQTGAASAAQAMQAGNGKAEDAAKLAQDAGSAIEIITQSIGQIRDMNNQIAAAAEEQSVAAEEISRNVVNMSDLARNAHTSASATRSTTDGLERTASDLGSVVSRFRL